MECACNTLGSSNLVCDYNTGQCPCLPKVATEGQRNTRGEPADRQCSSCIANHYSFYTGQGCLPCGCNRNGGQISQCNDTGTCICKPTIGGEKCDVCLPGYYLFSRSGCIMCNCSMEGSTGIECHPQLGTCDCKANVQGDKCDQCKTGSINLVASNPDGCQSCFCYGHSTQCFSAPGFITSQPNATSTSEWFIAESPYDASDRTYISSAQTRDYRGSWLHSYGQTFSVDMQTAQGVPIDISQRKVLIIKGTNGLMMYYNASGFIVDSKSKTLSARLHRNDWILNTTQPSREQFYSILTSIEAVYLKFRYESVSVALQNIKLETALKSAIGTPSMYVEQCDCQVGNVQGLSCENCLQGYRRTVINGTKYDACVACNCNDRGETLPPLCDENTGECMNCRNGTVGFNCESCAVNVQEPDCVQCVDGFYGMDKAGCYDCACHPVGSVSAICDKVTGQCECQPNVVGLKCDQCQDNFYNLTSKGCIECDSCYALILNEVEDLRVMRDNLTDYITTLSKQDMNTQLGPFHERLKSTVQNMDNLIVYLAQASSVEGQVIPEIQRLNRTFLTLTEQLDVTAVNLTATANRSITTSNLLLMQGSQVKANMEATSKETYLLTSTTLLEQEKRLQDLLASMEGVEQLLTGTSSGAMKDFVDKSTMVRKIESDTQTAKSTGIAILQKTKLVQETHKNTTEQLKILEQQIKTDGGTAGDVELLAQYSNSNARLLEQSVSVAYNNVTAMQALPYDPVAIQNTANQLKDQAILLTDKANNATRDSGQAVQQVIDAGLRTEQARAGITGLQQRATQLLQQSQAALTQTKQAVQLETNTFTSAENMLQVMSDFTNIAQDVEMKANESLQLTASIRSISETAISIADNLTEALTAANVSSKIAYNTALVARDQALQQVDNITPVSNKSQQLEVEASGILNDVDAKLQSVSTTNSTLVVTAHQKCDNLEVHLSMADQKSTQAYTACEATANKTNIITNSINILNQDLNNLKQLNSTNVNQLLDKVLQAREQFDRKQLGATITNLQGSLGELQTWLTVSETKRKDLREQIDLLTTIVQQLQGG